MKCSFCDEEHEGVILSPKCHPGRPMHVRAVQHPGAKEVTLTLECAKCGKFVAAFTGLTPRALQ